VRIAAQIGLDSIEQRSELVLIAAIVAERVRHDDLRVSVDQKRQLVESLSLRGRPPIRPRSRRSDAINSGCGFALSTPMPRAWAEKKSNPGERPDHPARYWSHCAGTRYWSHCAGMSTMNLDVDLIFPISDVPSAELMMVKAACLWNAGVIDDRQRDLVQQRAERFLQRGLAVPQPRASALYPASLAASARVANGGDGFARATLSANRPLPGRLCE
jgi:hypothetical protein